MKLLYFAFFIVCFHQLNAQQQTPAFKKFGFQAGASISNMDFNKGKPAPAAYINSSWKAGISLGLLMRVPLGKKWLLQPEYSYTQRNGADKSNGINYQLSYFSMPVLLHYKITSLLSLYAGPQAELLVQATSTANVIKTTITHDTEERSLAGIAGIEMRIMQSFFLSARYMHGFNHIGIGQRSSVKEFKYEAITITAGVYF